VLRPRDNCIGEGRDSSDKWSVLSTSCCRLSLPTCGTIRNYKPLWLLHNDKNVYDVKGKFSAQGSRESQLFAGSFSALVWPLVQSVLSEWRHWLSVQATRFAECLYKCVRCLEVTQLSCRVFSFISRIEWVLFTEVLCFIVPYEWKLQGF